MKPRRKTPRSSATNAYNGIGYLTRGPAEEDQEDYEQKVDYEQEEDYEQDEEDFFWIEPKTRRRAAAKERRRISKS